MLPVCPCPEIIVLRVFSTSILTKIWFIACSEMVYVREILPSVYSVYMCAYPYAALL